jgi:hypothetical protein
MYASHHLLHDSFHGSPTAIKVHCAGLSHNLYEILRISSVGRRDVVQVGALLE